MYQNMNMNMNNIYQNNLMNNMNVHNSMNNMHNKNFINNNVPNNYNIMNNNNINNNFINNNFPYNNIMNNNILFNNYMMRMNAQNMMMKKIIMQNNINLAMMQNKIRQQKMQNRMNQILNEANNQSNNNINNNIVMQYQEVENEDPITKQALIDVAKELALQKQKFEESQNQNNLNYNEVDPEFMHSFISDKQLFCGSGHNLEGKWAHGEYRGGRPYTPPDGWIGFGLNVLNKYDNGNNDWLACDGRPGEWCVAYHGACARSSSDQIKQIIKPILEQNLKPGGGQACQGHNDLNHPGQKVGIGVYCSPNPTVIEGYAGIIEVNGFRYKIAFMLRVKPDKIRISSSTQDYWVLNAGNGDFSEMRPYRFLIKKAC